MRIDPSIEHLPRLNTKQIHDLQGDLKDLSKASFERLKRSLEEEGFFVPLYIWTDPKTGKQYTMDGHQRLRYCHAEYPDGIDLPVVFISARNKEHAKKRLLLIDSRYGRITKEGFDQFIADLGDIEDFVLDFTTYDEFLDKDPVVTPATSPSVITRYALEVECSSEGDQEELFNDLTGKGYSCRILTL